MRIIDSPGAAAAGPNDAALAELLRALDRHSYRFVTPTIATYRLNRLRRSGLRRRSLQDIFGWNLSFNPSEIDAELFALMKSGRVVRRGIGGRVRSSVRIGSLEDALLLHSPPAGGRSPVFFGPDTYRFVRFLTEHAGLLRQGAHVVDYGSGAGGGALTLGRMRPDLRLTALDINPNATRVAAINCAAAGVAVSCLPGNGLAVVERPIDVVVANPPFLAGAIHGIHRNGGGQLGANATLAWMREAATSLAPGGSLLLYSASAIVRGRDALRAMLTRELVTAGFTVDYRELDPDVFGGMLWRPAYRNVERIAAITMVATRTR